MITTILFDRDDTLTYTDPQVYHQAASWMVQQYPHLTVKQVLHALQSQWAKSEYTWRDLQTLQQEEAFWHTYGTELVQQLNIPETFVQPLLQAYPYYRYSKLYPETEQVLTKLKSEGYTLAVLSNTMPSVQQSLEAVGIAQYISYAFSSCALGVHKPEPQVFLLCCEHMQVQPQNVLFVDDKAENVQAARDLGMQGLVISYGESWGDIQNLLGVVEYLQELEVRM